MIRLAGQMLNRHRGSAVATLLALIAGVAIVMALGTLVQSGLTYRPAVPKQLAAADMVIAHRTLTVTTRAMGDTEVSSVMLPEGGTVPAALTGRIRQTAGVATAMPIDTAGGQVAAVAVTFRAGADRDAVRRLATSAGMEAYTGADRGLAVETALDAQAQDLLVQAGSAFGGYVVMLAVFVVAATVGLSVRHRRRDLALLRAVAATPGQVRRMIVAEAALLGGLGAVLGIPLGLLVTHWTHGQLVDRGFLPAAFPIAGPALSALIAAGSAVLVAMLAALIAARRVTRIRPTEALGEVAVEPAGGGRVRLVSGLVLLAAAGALAVAGLSGAMSALAGADQAVASAAGMLYLMVGAVALLAPWINRAAARRLAPVLRGVWGTSGHLAAANLRANARGMAGVLAALVLSVGLGGSVWFLQDNLARETVSQNRAGTVADQALVAPAGLPAAALSAVRSRPGVRTATPVRHTSVILVDMGDAEAYPAQAVDPAGLAATMDLDVREGSMAALTGDTVAVSAMEASSEHWHLNQLVHLWLGDGAPVTVRIAAIYRRGFGFGDITLPISLVEGHTATNQNDEILVRDAPGAHPDLTTVAARYPGTTVTTAAALTTQLSYDLAANAWLNKLLVAVMVGYAALAAANTMVIAALARTRELAVLRLTGVTRRQVKRMVHAEQAGLLGVAVVIGVAAAAVTLISIVATLTGRPLPYVPALGYVIVLGGVTLLALGTTILPIGRLLRTAPVDQIGLRD